MINGTIIEPLAVSESRIYEYDDFSPMPFKSGDILGIFIPDAGQSQLIILSENADSPTNYYLSTGSSTESPYDMIDIQSTPVMEERYWPMVSVEIGKK